MVKNIRATLDDNVYEEMTSVKGDRTWLDVLWRGIESIEAYLRMRVGKSIWIK